MLTKTLSEAKKKQRNILIKAMNNDIGSIDSAKDSWNPAQISERAKDISYIRSLVDIWNPAQLNEALRMLDLPIIDTWNPAQIEEQRRNLVFYLVERTLTGNPITLNIIGNLTPEVTGLKVSMLPIQDLNGYDQPWAGGAGKNKFQVTATSTTINQVDYTINSDGTVLVNGTASGNSEITLGNITLPIGTYKFNGCSFNGLGARLQLKKDATTLVRVYDNSDNAITVTEEGTYQITFVVISGTQVNNLTVYPMIRLSTVTDATFAPYSNICPITGRSEVTVTRTAGEDVETKTHEYSETIYGGTDDFINGGLSNEWGYIASYDDETLPGVWMSDRNVYASGTTPTTGAEVVYRLATPTTITTTAEEITLLKGTNVLSTDGNSIELKYKQNF